jgi:hypothetical protein
MLCAKHIRRLIQVSGIVWLLGSMVAGGRLQAQTGNTDRSSIKRSVNGAVEDAASGESLLGASVYAVDAQGGLIAGTSSNEYGFYSLTLRGAAADDSLRLVYSFVGYAEQRILLPPGEDRSLTVRLEPALELETVTVSAKAAERQAEQTQMSAIEIPVAQIKSLPAFLGEVDVLKVLQLLPGVQSGNEGATGLYVRGGGPDQNLILLDGVPVYNASHLFGFFSVFNADAVNKVELIKGGFPARYGGRLSSVVDIRLKEGNTQGIHGSGSIGLIASKAMLEGPIGKDGKSSWLVSGRRTYIDLLAQPIIALTSDGVNAGYYFYDLNAKINRKISDKDRIYLSGYFGRDRFYFSERSRFNRDGITDEETFKGSLEWGNATAVMRWNRIWSPTLFSNLTATYSAYDFEISNDVESIYEDGSTREESRFALRLFSGIGDATLRQDFDWVPHPNHYLRFGASGSWQRFRPSATTFDATQTGLPPESQFFGNERIDAGLLSAYVEDDWKLGPRLKANVGLHGAAFAVDGEWFTSLQPRISARYLVAPEWSIKGSYAQMAQFIHLLSNAGLGLPTDLWVPATERIRPESSWQVALGLARDLGDAWSFSAEGYYKVMEGVVEYKDGATFLDNGVDDWQDKVVQGTGTSYGGELFAQKKQGKTTGWIGYTLSWTWREFDALNGGQRFPYRYDRRHDLSVAVVHRFNERIEISGAWVYGTGNAISLPVASYAGLYGFPVYAYEGRNGYRMAPYHRLDFGARFSKKKRRYTRHFAVGVYNAYSRNNPFFIYAGQDDFGNDAYKQVSLFPILPSFSWQFDF